jgi:two-component system response regulator YesN
MTKTLLVEDSSHFRQLLRDHLKERFPSMSIEEATDATEAMNKIDSFCPDLIFMDIRLPGVNGLELTRRIKEKCPDIHIIVLTSYDLPEYRETARQYGANHFIAKGSTTMEEILALAKSCVSSELGAPLCSRD